MAGGFGAAVYKNQEVKDGLFDWNEWEGYSVVVSVFFIIQLLFVQESNSLSQCHIHWQGQEHNKLHHKVLLRCSL